MNITGMDKAMRDLANLEKNVKAAQRRGELKAAQKISSEASAAAPGSLGSRIVVTQTENDTTIDAGDELAAYAEFGTGEFAKQYLAGMSDDVRKEALKFFVSGKGKSTAKPYFFPAINRNQATIIADVEDELKKLDK